LPDHIRPEFATDEIGGLEAELLELMTRRPAWWADAACRAAPAHVSWFPDRESGPAAEAAKAICRRCLVLEECRGWALDQGSSLVGVFGGMTTADRKKLRRQPKAA
jgi:WhiB family redox-sensing transcriptional regulator